MKKTFKEELQEMTACARRKKSYERQTASQKEIAANLREVKRQVKASANNGLGNAYIYGLNFEHSSVDSIIYRVKTDLGLEASSCNGSSKLYVFWD